MPSPLAKSWIERWNKEARSKVIVFEDLLKKKIKPELT